MSPGQERFSSRFPEVFPGGDSAGLGEKKSVLLASAAYYGLVLKGTVTGRWLCLAVAALALTCQVAASSHSAAFHDEAPSKCHDDSRHFCAEIASEEAGRCFLCQVSVGNLTVSPPMQSEVFVFIEATPTVDGTHGSSFLKFSPAAPRAPPSFPA
jgi:hypothetical protein